MIIFFHASKILNTKVYISCLHINVSSYRESSSMNEESTNRPRNDHSPLLLCSPSSSPLNLHLPLLINGRTRTRSPTDRQRQYLSHQPGETSQRGAHVEGQEAAKLG